MKSFGRFLLLSARPIPQVAAGGQTVGVPGATIVALALTIWRLGLTQGVILTLAILCLLFLLAGVRLEYERRAAPRLVCVGLDNAAASVVEPHPPAGHIVHGIAYFVRVQVANDPGLAVRGTRAERTVGRIAFLDESGSLLMPEIYGRWAETPQRMETGRIGISLEEAQLDIDANGLPHPLDIAMKDPADACFYAYNHENSTAPLMKLPQHKLTVSACRVRVTLRAANASESVRYLRLSNHGVGGKLTLEFDR